MRIRISLLGRYFFAPAISLLGAISLLRFRLRSWDDIFSLRRDFSAAAENPISFFFAPGTIFFRSGAIFPPRPKTRFRSSSLLGRYFFAPAISLLGGISLLRFRLRSWDDIFSLLRFRSWAQFRSSDFAPGHISLLRNEVRFLPPPARIAAGNPIHQVVDVLPPPP